MLAAARQRLDRHYIAMSVLAQGDNSPYMTEEFKQGLVEANESLARYTTSRRTTK